jgi:hypothetical protein
MDKDLSVERHYHASWDSRKILIKAIFDAVELSDPRQLTCHGMQVLSSKVLESLKHDFMKSRGYAYKDLLIISPFEFTWYNAWLQKSRIIDIVAVEPFFKTFHMRLEYAFARLRCLELNDWARAYVGIVLNSNWRKAPPDIYRDPGYWENKFYRFVKRNL